MTDWINKLLRRNTITAGGDVTGRDKITNILPKPTQMDILNQKYEEEVTNSIENNYLIDELQHYSCSLHTERTLSTKLSSAGFEFVLEEAEELKELISKIIVKHQNFKSAQKIITLLLANVESTFNINIKPRLKNIEDEQILKQILKEHLEDVILEQLGSNVLEIYQRHVRGMTFFLTGNCHIEWE
jgi:hypothetical protein